MKPSRLKAGIAPILAVLLGVVLAGCSDDHSAGNLAPVAAFSVSTVVASSYQQVVFDASESEDPDDSIVSYSWVFGDGEIGSGEVVTHAYTGGKIAHTVVLTVKDSRGAVGTEQTTIYIVDCEACGDP